MARARFVEMSDAISRIDAACIPRMVADSPVSFEFDGVGYTGTAGPRDTMKELTEGGFHADEEFLLMAAVEQFDGQNRPTEKDQITIYLTADGIPCSAEDAASSKNMRVKKVGRSGAALTFTLGTIGRG